MISSISSNPVENKVISNALDNKSDKTIAINEHPLAESFSLIYEDVGVDISVNSKMNN